MKRFEVRMHERAYYVHDIDAKSYQAPINSCPIFFKSKDRPEQICNLLNAEWLESLHEPQ